MRPASGLERRQCRRLILDNLEMLVLSSDGKHIHDSSANIAEFQVSACFLDFLVQHDQTIQCCTRQELDVRKIE